MEIVKEGHVYSLQNFEDKTTTQRLAFIDKEKDANGNLQTISDGTTNEEVLKVLVDRLEYLGGVLASEETKKAVEHIKQAIVWLEIRTKLRKEQNVEGTAQPHISAPVNAEDPTKV